LWNTSIQTDINQAVALPVAVCATLQDKVAHIIDDTGLQKAIDAKNDPT
jgi:hypothetical protein